jgi:hypothetical protein
MYLLVDIISTFSWLGSSGKQSLSFCSGMNGERAGVPPNHGSGEVFNLIAIWIG